MGMSYCDEMMFASIVLYLGCPSALRSGEIPCCFTLVAMLDAVDIACHTLQCVHRPNGSNTQHVSVVLNKGTQSK